MQPLQVLGLGDRTAEVVDEDGGGAVGLQQGPEEPLQEGDELLVLLGLAHLGVRGRGTRSQEGDTSPPTRHFPHAAHRAAAADPLPERPLPVQRVLYGSHCLRFAVTERLPGRNRQA